MSTDNETMIKHILDWVSRIGYIKPEDIPNIDLYMDSHIPSVIRMTRSLPRP